MDAQPLATPSRPRGETSLLKTPARTPGGGAMEQTSRTPVVDFAALEAHKENITRSAGGRSAAALSSTLSLAPAERARVLAERAAEFEDECEAAVSAGSTHPDPLDPWVRYAHWAINAYPAHSTKLVPLLERATRLFKDAKRYTQDAKYLQMWVWYARNSAKPHNIFQFLLAQEIGTQLSTLYEELAVVLESRAFYEQADATYKLGLARLAKPVDRLKRRYRDYQGRILAASKPLSASAPAPTYKAALEAAMASAERSMLGEKASTGTGGPSRAANVVRGFGGTAGLPSRAGLGALPNNGRRVDVFRDDEEEAAQHPGKSAPWDELGSAAVRAQETPGGGPRPWKGEVLPQRAPARPLAPASARPVAPIEVFRDSDEEETPPRLRKARGGLFGKEESEETQLTTRLREDPLANYASEVKRALSPDEIREARYKAARAKKVPSSSSTAAPVAVPRKIAQATSATDRKKERLVVPLELLYTRFVDNSEYPEPNEDAGEVCMEELLARKYGAQMGRDTDPWAHLDATQGQWLPRPASPLHAKERAPALQMQKLKMHEPLQQRKSSQKLRESPQPAPAPLPPPAAQPALSAAQHASAEASPEPLKPLRREPTVTMMTAMARDEIKGLFNGRDSDDSDDSSDDDDEDDEDVHPLASVSRPLHAMMRPSDAVPPTPTPAARGTARGVLQPVVAAPPMAAPAPASTSVPATPAKSALGASALGTRKPLALAPRLGSSDAEPVRAKRIEASALLATAEEDEEEEDEDEEQDEEELDEHHYHNLTRVTEVTEMTRLTRVSARSLTCDAADESPAVARAVLRDGLPQLTREALEDRSWTSSAHQDALSGSIDEQSDWGREREPDMSRGHTIERPADERTGALRHERLNESFVVLDAEAAPESSFVHEERSQRIALPDRGTLPALPNPCSPSDPEVIHAILASLEKPLESYAAYVDLGAQSAGGRLEQLRKGVKPARRRSLSASGGAPAAEKAFRVDIAGLPFSVRSLLGEGGFGSVFLAEDVSGAIPLVRRTAEGQSDSSFSKGLSDLSSDEDDEEEMERRRLVAVKVEAPPNRWEFYILDQLRKRLDDDTLTSIVGARKFFAYKDESFLVLEYANKGSLLDVVNQASASGVAPPSTLASSSGTGSTGVEELLAMYFTVELLRIVEQLHAAGIIHGDLKIDNCLLRLDEAPAGQMWSNDYCATGANGWRSKGLTLIDFGRAVDLKRVAPDHKFIADWQPDARDCPEMREGREWTYETDYFGVASVAFCLLFGRYIETLPLPPSESGQPRYKIAQTLRRYWQVELWTRLFDVLLNARSQRPDAALPIHDEVRALRQEMEAYVEKNCNRAGKNLKGLMRKLQVHSMKLAQQAAA